MRFFKMAVAAVLGLSAVAQIQADDKWVTIKGQVKLSKVPDHVKPDQEVKDLGADKAHCSSKGPISKQNIIINKDNKGLQNVIIFLRPNDEERNSKLKESDIHPNLLKPTSKTLVIDQPCCQFEPRVTLARVGDRLTVKNSSPIGHNFRYSSGENGEANPNIPSEKSYDLPQPLKYEPRYFKFSCSVHPWMGGIVQVFDHPYFAVTDKDGKFEIKDAPAGKFRIVYTHEEGYHKGKDGRFGETIEIKGPTLELKPIEYEFAKPN